MAQYLHPCRTPHLAPRFCTQLASLSLWPPDLLAPCPLQCLDRLLGYGHPTTKRSQVSLAPRGNEWERGIVWDHLFIWGLSEAWGVWPTLPSP